MTSEPGTKPTFRKALRFWLELGLVSFGGPAGQIGIMHRELVERRKWIEEKRFLNALNFCMLLPGPEATQLATYCGWLLHGTRGGLVAGILFVLPATVVLGALSWIYMAFGSVPLVTGVFFGLKAAVLAIVVAAVLRIGRQTLRSTVAWLFAGAAFYALHDFNVPFPAVVFGALGAGFLIGARWPQYFREEIENSSDDAKPLPSGSVQRSMRTAIVGIAVWLAPVVAAALVFGPENTLTRIGWFFSKAALVTFGGAYAVLPYVSQQAVTHYAWLAPGQMLDGLGLAETTPGPLIIVLQFVGFVAAWQHPGGLPSVLAALLGAGMATWTTFVPSYLFILVGAPHVEGLRKNAGLSASLAAVTAAVVGVIFNLAVWFAQQTLTPAGQIDGVALAIAILAFVALHFFRAGIVVVVIASGLLGLAWSLF